MKKVVFVILSYYFFLTGLTLTGVLSRNFYLVLHDKVLFPKSAHILHIYFALLSFHA